ncbi:uncharacterized protein HD556DRAFT_1243118 [Suillus plorans]|uniref:Uncharacterized protein n=1 Tax=Suillus plorans TaxID=116603 RepID=A0A9P7AJS1_9AGAM|nr:uncharacterized protein HD556DRAFT_1243118 [Suillus plorans]KAG1789805.1 hypothetical protein HD556DRAFT_1243118 [Suillus plorans]
MTNQEGTKYAPRISELAVNTNLRVLIDRILNSQIQISAREILAASKDLSGSLIDLLKPESGKDWPTAETFLTWGQMVKTCGDLIYIDADINGCKVKAIFDTGSEINILNTAIYRKGLRLLADMNH